MISGIAALSSPLTLTPGTAYVIGGYDPASSDAHVWDVFLPGFPGYEVTGFSVASEVAVEAAGMALMGPNFLYDASPVPEPGTIEFGGTAFFGMLMLALRRRGTVTVG